MAGKGESDSSERRITAREKQAMVLRLRKAGATFEQIAAEVGYANEGSAYKAFKVALQRTIQVPADEYRTLHRERLEELYRLTMEQIIACSLAGVSVARLVEVADKVLASLAKLDGLDAPKKIADVTPLYDEIKAKAVARGLPPEEAERIARQAITEAAASR